MTDATGRPATHGADAAAIPVMGVNERSLDTLLDGARRAAPHELPTVFDEYATALGLGPATVYLVDLQQNLLIPFVTADGPGHARKVDDLGVDTTLAGRSYQYLQVLVQDVTPPGGGNRAWLPLLNGSERLGVVSVDIGDVSALDDGGALRIRLRRFAALVSELVMTKALYGDALVRLRRRSEMGLAAEMQWGLLPPLNFSGNEITIAAALEPAYEVAGDSVDYAIDAGWARFAVFDGMGHSLQSAQLATVAVAAYRNARRAGQPLVDVARSVDAAIGEAFGGDSFATAVLAELATDTGRLSWVSAGHPEPLLIRHGRIVRSLHVDPTLPFGLGSDFGGVAGVTVGNEQLEPGDQVLLYTDGVIEARSPDGEFFGTARLGDLLSRNLADALPASESMRRLVRALLDHQQGQLDDDATLLLAEWCTIAGAAPTADPVSP